MRYLLFFFFPCLIFAAPLRVEVQAPSAILINGVTGKILYEKNAFVLRPPASITKVATAWFLLEKKARSFEELVTVAPDSIGVVNSAVRHSNFTKYPAYRLETGGTSFGLRGGEKVPFSLLIHAMMISSANDAANALAHFYSNGVDQFMLELNAFLKSKGIVNTHFSNPHGLHYPDHKTTAFDMAQMARLAMQNPYFQNIVKTVSYPGKQPQTPLLQTNKLLRPGKFYYSKATGIKTGYTASAGSNLVASAENEERKLIAVLMGCKTSDDRFKDAIVLFEKAFSEKKVFRKLLTREFDVFTTNIEGGESTLKAHPFQDLSLEYFPSEEPAFEVKVNWKPKQLPITAGDDVGSIQIVSSEKKIILEESLVAMNSLHGTFSYRFFTGTKMVFGNYKVIWISMSMLMIIGLLFYFRVQKYLKK